MRNLVAGSLVAAALSFGLAGVPALAADADPTVQQIYEAARSGHLDQAQQMMNQVLRDHPESSKAHYVQSELYAREGNLGLARSELARAEQLDPGLTKENPRSVQELKAQLGLLRKNESSFGGVTSAPASPRFPWGTVVILALVVGVFWMLFRRRRTYVQYPAAGAPGAYGPGGYAGPGPGGYAGPGPGYGGPGGGMTGGGLGSNIAGGLAGGLAAGAGLVAGEELAHHFLDGDRRPVAPPAGDDGSWGSGSGNPNADMGGNDFGVNDPGSWDDGSSGGDSGGGGGGGDDWT
ncbi:MAG: tetratricopeptide repeat protein [Steroidobacteraceae bacterium]|jgi:hypothetical protein